jgi:hypothetical protein
MVSELLTMTFPALTQESAVYSLFGLRIRSALPLPCSKAGDFKSDADVELIESTEEQIAAPCNGAPVHFSEDDGYWLDTLYQDGAARVRWKEHFEFVVSADRSRVLWRRWEGVPDRALFAYLLGHVLSYCLLARGLEPLHATSVVVDGKAIALLGDSGYGKSTLAAALLDRGCRLLTDDVLVLEFQGQQLLAHPSLAHIKLTPDSADAVFHGRRSVFMNAFTSKMIFSLEESQHVPRLVPLHRVYLVPAKSGSKISVRSVRGRAAFLPIIKNTFNNVVLTPSRLKQQFAFASRLTSRVVIKRLSYPKRLELLPAVVDAILADLSREQSSL